MTHFGSRESPENSGIPNKTEPNASTRRPPTDHVIPSLDCSLMSIEGRMPGVTSITNAKRALIIPGIIVNECPPVPVASGPASEVDDSQTMCCAQQLTLSGPSKQRIRASASVSRSKRLTVSQVTLLERAFNNDHNPTHAQECLMANHFNV